MLTLDDPESNVKVLNAIEFKPKVVEVPDGVVVNVKLKDFIPLSGNISIVDINVDPPIAKTDFIVKYSTEDASWIRVADSKHTVPILKNHIKRDTRVVVGGKHLSRGFIVESVCKSKVGLYSFVPWYGSVPKVYGWYKLVTSNGGITRQFFECGKCDAAEKIKYPAHIPTAFVNVDQASLYAMNKFQKLRSEDVTYTNTFDLLVRLNAMLTDSIDPLYMLKAMRTICDATNGCIN